MSDSYTFAAVETAADVTDILNNNKASKARVAAVGQANPGAQFQVWYVPSDHHHWNFIAVDFDNTSTTDTDTVTKTLHGSSVAAVTFFGQAKKYYVWWLD